jgi:predicted dehydrogenase
LEKPGAPTVAELEAMRDEASAAGVAVKMGYNKNVCKFVTKAREYQAANGGHITFVSNNSYENTAESLGECFERNSEGMLSVASFLRPVCFPMNRLLMNDCFLQAC